MSFQRFRDIVESSRDWIWETDEEGRFTYLSPNTRELLGMDPRALLGIGKNYCAALAPALNGSKPAGNFVFAS